MEFSEGAGSADVVALQVQRTIDPHAFARERMVVPGLELRSPEELYYYRIWREVMGANLCPLLVGRTHDHTAAISHT